MQCDINKLKINGISDPIALFSTGSWIGAMGETLL